jgi:hypothetical protein
MNKNINFRSAREIMNCNRIYANGNGQLVVVESHPFGKCGIILSKKDNLVVGSWTLVSHKDKQGAKLAFCLAKEKEEWVDIDIAIPYKEILPFDVVQAIIFICQREANKS